MNITVIGLGYVGLPTALVFANSGFNVFGIDVNKEKVEIINKGMLVTRDSELGALYKKVISKGRFKATTNGKDVIVKSDAIIVSVPTPVEQGVVDLSYLRNALQTIKHGFRRNQLIVIESTVPPGTTVRFVKPFLEQSGFRADVDFFLAHVPERIAPGRAVEELQTIPRIIGGIGPRSLEKTLELYKRVNPYTFQTDATTAEFVKLAENTFRDLNIAFANFLALAAERLGIDVFEAIRLANTHPRVGIHWPGAGVGGPCLTKDPYMLVSAAEGVPGIELIRVARRINEFMPLHTTRLVERALVDTGIDLSDARVTVLGVAYKGGIEDTRGSPAAVVVRELLSRGLDVVVFDPYTDESFGAMRADSIENALNGSDALVVITDHPEFRQLDLGTVKKVMRHRVIVDGRRVFEPHIAVENGFKYYGIGYGRAFKL